MYRAVTRHWRVFFYPVAAVMDDFGRRTRWKSPLMRPI